VSHDVPIGEAAGPAHEVDDDFIGDAYDNMVADVSVPDIGGGIVSEYGQSLANTRDVLGVVVDEQVDVLGEPGGSMRDDGEAADQHVPCPGGIQRPADADDVVRLGRACVRWIVSVSHLSASAKLSKR